MPTFRVRGRGEKVPLSELQRDPLFVRIEQPAIVYHMTPRKNLDSILNDGKIKVFDDFICYFFPALEEIPVYVKLTGALHGRQYIGFDGKSHTAPPLIPAEQIVLKLVPRYSEPLYWYRENTLDRVMMQAERENWTEERLQEVIKRQTAFDLARVLHYGDMKFRQQQVEILELSDYIPANLEEMEFSEVMQRKEVKA